MLVVGTIVNSTSLSTLISIRCKHKPSKCESVCGFVGRKITATQLQITVSRPFPWTGKVVYVTLQNIQGGLLFVHHYLTGSHAMQRNYLKTTGGRPRPDWCLLSNQLTGHKINGSKRINKRNQSRSGKTSNITKCTRKWTSQYCQIWDLKRLLFLRNRDSAVKMTTVGLNDNSGWPNRRMWINVLLVILEYCGWL